MPTQTSNSSDDAEALRAERDALKAEVEALKTPKIRHSRQRFGTLLVVLASITFLVSVFGYWANRNFLDTDVWVERVAPLAQDPAVQKSIADEMTVQIMTVVKPEKLFEEALPERGKILAAPLASAVSDFVNKQALKLVQTKQFQELWIELNRNAHSKAVDVLKGDSTIVRAGRNSVVINFIPLVNDVLADISKQSPELFGKDVKIPKVTINSVPAVARQKISEAFGVDIPKNFGTVTIYDRGALKSAQDGLKTFDKLLVLSIILTVVFAGAAFLVTNRRRRTGLQLLFGLSVALIIVRRVVLYADKLATNEIKDPSDQVTARHIIHAFIDPLLANTEKVLIAFAVIAAVLILTANYEWVVTLRHRVVHLVKQGFTAARTQATDESTTKWIASNHQLLEIGIAAVFLILLWEVSFSWFGLLLWAVLFGGLELMVRRIAEAHQIAPVDSSAKS